MNPCGLYSICSRYSLFVKGRFFLDQNISQKALFLAHFGTKDDHNGQKCPQQAGKVQGRTPQNTRAPKRIKK